MRNAIRLGVVTLMLALTIAAGRHKQALDGDPPIPQCPSAICP